MPLLATYLLDKTKADIANAVKNYDFQGHTGLGMMFFVGAMVIIEGRH